MLLLYDIYQIRGRVLDRGDADDRRALRPLLPTASLPATRSYFFDRRRSEHSVTVLQMSLTSPKLSFNKSPQLSRHGDWL